MQLINGTYAPNNIEEFRSLYNSLLNTQETDRADRYFILKDFRAYSDARETLVNWYKDGREWAKKSILNIACSGKFSSDRTIQEYVNEIWHLRKVKL